MRQAFDTCLQDKIGAHGLAPDVFKQYLQAAGEGAQALKAAHHGGSLHHLACVLGEDDLTDIKTAAARICARARDVIICGTGGSSLGGQALAQVAGWHTPGPENTDTALPRLHFIDNLDAQSSTQLLSACDLATTHLLLISKSGGTVETLSQLAIFADAYGAAGLALKDHATGISDPAVAGKPNLMRSFLEARDVALLEHYPQIGGRYAALTNVGLLPAALAGLSIDDVRAGARATAQDFLSTAADASNAPVAGAALNAALALEHGCTITVMLAYADRLERFVRWFVQLWAESLGKQGQGSTPLAALGPVDQHSQLQLFLDGPRDKLFTLIQTQTQGSGPVIDAEIAKALASDALGAKTIGDLVHAMQHATADTLAQNGCPVRTLQLEKLDAHAMGGLMMHFILETIIAAHIFKVDPFDQPAVEQGKILARHYLAQL